LTNVAIPEASGRRPLSPFYEAYPEVSPTGDAMIAERRSVPVSMAVEPTAAPDLRHFGKADIGLSGVKRLSGDDMPVAPVDPSQMKMFNEDMVMEMQRPHVTGTSDPNYRPPNPYGYSIPDVRSGRSADLSGSMARGAIGGEAAAMASPVDLENVVDSREYIIPIVSSSRKAPDAALQQTRQQAAAANGAAAAAAAKADAPAPSAGEPAATPRATPPVVRPAASSSAPPSGPDDGYDFWHRPLNGVVVDAAKGWGWNPDHARILEQAAAGLIATGVGGGALYAALQGLQPAQQPVVIT
jgi:hypothetical protein